MKIKRIVLVTLACLLMCSCTAVPETDPTESALAAVYTSMARTYAVDSTLRVEPSHTPAPPPTETPTPTSTTAAVILYLVYEPETTDTPDATPTKPCYDAAHVSDVNIPDGTVMKPGTAFTKTWRIKNTGACDWTPLFALDFGSGEQMGGSAVEIGTTVKPGETVTISVPLTAPTVEGNYVANWVMRNESWDHFGMVVFLMIKVDG